MQSLLAKPQAESSIVHCSSASSASCHSKHSRSSGNHHQKPPIVALSNITRCIDLVGPLVPILKSSNTSSMSITPFEAIFAVAGRLMDSILYWLTIALMIYCFRRRVPVNDPVFIHCVVIFGLINILHDLYLIVNYPWSILGIFSRLYFVRLIVDLHESRTAQAMMVSIIAIAYSLSAHQRAQHGGAAQCMSRGTP